MNGRRRHDEARKAFVALNGGKLLSWAIVVNLNSAPASPAPGVHVMMPLFIAGDGAADVVVRQIISDGC